MSDFFFINDESERIKRIQEWLRMISKNDSDINEVFIDGIYGNETKNAVQSIQNKYGLKVTGELDKETFDLIFKLYTDLQASKNVLGYRPKFSQYEGQVISPGDVFDDVYTLQLLFRELSLKDERFFVDINGSIDSATENAVRLLQSTLGRESTGKVDVSLWNALVLLTEQNEGYI